MVYLPDDRRTAISPFGGGNPKLGPGVYTYSRTAVATCPGRTIWCSNKCYAKRVDGIVGMVWHANEDDDIPGELPEDCTLFRWHVGGDFDTEEYLRSWIVVVKDHPHVQFWGYTRSWRVPELLSLLTELRDLPNVVLFASTDQDVPALQIMDMINHGWRISWISTDRRGERAFKSYGQHTVTCPEELGKIANCVDCGYCFNSKSKGGVTFVEH